jgi:Cdc6-like AAA superfamily ATPase
MTRHDTTTQALSHTQSFLAFRSIFFEGYKQKQLQQALQNKADNDKKQN